MPDPTHGGFIEPKDGAYAERTQTHNVHLTAQSVHVDGSFGLAGAAAASN